ncbi:MAG: PqiC family protein [Acetobacteraceae bacterium]
MRRRTLLLAPLVLAAARCASPDPAMYTLRAVPGAAQGGGPVAVKVARPGLAGYLDRSEIVRDSTANRLLLRGGERWGEPLGDMIGRVLAEDLAQRLPGTSVFTEAGAISADASATVELDVQRFDLDATGVVVLLAQVAVQQGRGHDPALTRSLRLTTQPTADGTPELVTAMSALVGQLADAVAGMLRQPSARPTPLQAERRARSR